MVNKEKIAENISKVFSPVVMAFIPTLLFSLYPQFETQNFNFWISLASGIFFLSIFPALAVLYYTRKGKIDLWVSDREARSPFYLIAIIGYVLASIVFYYLDYHLMFILSVAYIYVTGVLLLVNLLWKVSTHSGGVTGPITALIYVFGWKATPFLVFIPIVFWARKKLKAHTFSQLIAGVIIAGFTTWIVYVILYS
ncbi:MAG: hypothetical protein V5A64_03730 [Candidatus Thermoplasmatota archaeon]